MKTKYIVFFAVTAGIVAFDFWTKAWIVDSLAYRNGYSVIDGFFNIVHARNRGAAFGLLSEASQKWTIPFFLTVGLLACGFLASLLRKVPPQRRLIPALLGGIAGGAVGNTIDRIRWNYVVDFLDFHVGQAHWPAFNVADIGISCGGVALFVLALLNKDDGLFSSSHD